MTIRKGDIVRAESGFDRTLQGFGTRRAGLPLDEKSLYQVIDCARGEDDIVLKLIQVRVFHLGGVRHVVKVGFEPFSYVSRRFEVVYGSGSSANRRSKGGVRGDERLGTISRRHASH